MSDSQKVIQCYHCGNETLMNLLSEHKECFEEGFYWLLLLLYLQNLPLPSLQKG